MSARPVCLLMEQFSVKMIVCELKNTPMKTLHNMNVLLSCVNMLMMGASVHGCELKFSHLQSLAEKADGLHFSLIAIISIEV